ncbi:MAG: sugar transferase [Candidatus Eisenbacteria bacterium]
MAVVQTRPGQAGAQGMDSWAPVEGLAAPRTRISGRRVFALTLPGLIFLDAVLVTGSFWVALNVFTSQGHRWLWQANALRPQLLALFAVLVVSFLVMGGMFGLYSRRCLLRPRQAMAAAARALFWSGAVAVVFAFLLALDPPGDFRWLLVKHALLLAVGAMVVRPLVCRGLLHLAEVGPVVPRRILILGDGPDAARLAGALERSAANEAFIVGMAGLGERRPGETRRWARFRLGDWQDAGGLADALAADEVIVSTPEIGRAQAVRLSFALSDLGIQVQVMPRLSGMHVEGTPVTRERGIPLARLGRYDMSRWGSMLKRLTDLVLTLSGGILLLPLLLVIAAAVKLTSRGPVLYAQTRVGRDGRRFPMYKFRSMKACNDDSHHRSYIEALMKEGAAAGWDSAGRPVYKLIDDPRVTMVGRIIRATSLDELPQLINVLRGEMSLVGPRPCLPFEYELYEDWQRVRLHTTPGMTGLWQVSGRSLLSFEEMVLLDLFYVANWSFMLDFKILCSTIPEVISPGGGR